MSDVEIRGAEQLAELGRTLKSVDATTLRQDLRTNLRVITKPLTAEMKASLRGGLPKSGGLADLMGSASIGVRVRTEGRDVGVRIVAQKAGHNLAAVDAGEIRHPVFGRRPSVRQSVRPHLVTDPFERAKPAAQAAVLKAMDSTASKVTK